MKKKRKKYWMRNENKRMKIRILSLFSLFFLPTLLHAQKNSLEVSLSTGLRGEVFQESTNGSLMTGEEELILKQKLSMPSADFTLTFYLTDIIALESGCTYVQNKVNFHPPIYDDYDYFEDEKPLLYNAIQIPLRIKFDAPIGSESFSIFGKIGAVFQFALTKTERRMVSAGGPTSSSTKNWPDPPEEPPAEGSPIEYYLYSISPLHKFNILLNPVLGFSYKLKMGLGISLFGEYYMGFRHMASTYIFHRPSGAYDWNYDELKFKGDYWNVGISIFYTIK